MTIVTAMLLSVVVALVLTPALTASLLKPHHGGPRGGFFTVYILAPIVGALAGAAVYEFILRPGLATSNEGGAT